MKRLQGKIGIQEGVNLCTISVVTTVLFMVNGEELYGNGNSSYISLPLSVFFALICILPLIYAMGETKCSSLPSFFRYALGPIAGGVAGMIVLLLLGIGAFSMLSKFVGVMHSFVYAESEYETIILWLMLTATVLAMGGFERVGRTAKCFGLFLGLCLVLILLLPMEGYSLHRLYPLPGKGLGDILAESLFAGVNALGALLCILINGYGLHGPQCTKKTLLIACGIGALLILAAQFCISLSFSYKELQNLYIPLYYVDMILPTEGFFLRFDKLSLFIFLMGALITGAFYLYSGALLGMELFGGRDIRPPLLTGGAFLAALICLRYEKLYELVNSFLMLAEKCGFFIIFSVSIIAALMGLVKNKRWKRMEERA